MAAAEQARPVARACDRPSGYLRAVRRYAIVGTGARSGMFVAALADPARAVELVALCDVNETRMRHHAQRFRDATGGTVGLYPAERFDALVAETRPDTVIVASIDRTHDEYIVRAMELGCDVITEKPIAIDAERCARIVRAVGDTGRDLRVAFNYRYAPVNAKVKEVIAGGAIGEVLSIHFEWLLDTRHGADYFRRWHRDKANSGGLMVHKATHHLDLVNWWIGSWPDTVFAMGDLRFYGRENARRRGSVDPERDDPFALDLAADPLLKALYLDAAHEDGYHRDQSVFGEGISIEDTMAALVHYRNGAVMSYALNAHCPREGYRVAFNGSAGRLDVEVVERPHVAPGGADLVDPSLQDAREEARPVLTLQRHWERPQVVPVDGGEEGGHGGGDVRLLDDLLGGGGDDPLGRAAGHLDGARSLLAGAAANRSFATGQPVRLDDLLRLD